jgi:hypothetical protein
MQALDSYYRIKPGTPADDCLKIHEMEKNKVFLIWDRFLKKHGAKYPFYDSRTGDLRSVSFDHKPPIGWRRDPKGAGFIPKKNTAEGKAILKEWPKEKLPTGINVSRLLGFAHSDGVKTDNRTFIQGVGLYNSNGVNLVRGFVFIRKDSVQHNLVGGLIPITAEEFKSYLENNSSL